MIIFYQFMCAYADIVVYGIVPYTVCLVLSVVCYLQCAECCKRVTSVVCAVPVTFYTYIRMSQLCDPN